MKFQFLIGTVQQALNFSLKIKKNLKKVSIPHRYSTTYLVPKITKNVAKFQFLIGTVQRKTNISESSHEVFQFLIGTVQQYS